MTIDWKTTAEAIPYPRAVQEMQDRVAAIRAGQASEQVWLLEHPACYTAGTSAQDTDLIDVNKFPVYQTGRGGKHTYHGPGQRIVYAMMDIQTRKIGIREYVCWLEKWVIRTLKEFGVSGELRDGKIGVWVNNMGRYNKIAALGVRVSRGVAFHGVSINVNPNLTHYRGIVPCGIASDGVTSLDEMGIKIAMKDFDIRLKNTFQDTAE